MENIDKNIQIIADWAKSQQKEKQNVQSTDDDSKPIQLMSVEPVGKADICLVSNAFEFY